MPQFNASSALLLKRFIESGVTSRKELARAGMEHAADVTV